MPMSANSAVQKLLDRFVERDEETGVQVAAWLGEEQIVDCWAGVADPETGRLVDGDTLFNVFSVTKAVTATCLHIQAERGLVDYDAPVARYWPEFAAEGKGNITVKHVLSHISGAFRMPQDVSPERLSDWDWIVKRLAEMPPDFPAGSGSSYQGMSFGWLVGEIVRRTDPKGREFKAFLKDELADPIGATDLWIGIPDEVEPRIAKLDGAMAFVAPEGDPSLGAIPAQVALLPDPFERPDVRRAMVPAVGGIFNARSSARVWALLANGGTFNGERLLSEERVRSFVAPREHFDQPDPIFFNMPIPMSWSGYWMGGDNPPICAPRSHKALCHPGMGGNIGWADLDTGLAVAFCHNRMVDWFVPDSDHRMIVGDTIRAAIAEAVA